MIKRLLQPHDEVCVCAVCFISIYFIQYLSAAEVQWAGALLIFIVCSRDVMKDKHRQTQLKPPLWVECVCV